MKSDITRLTFEQSKHYRAVQQQQGRVHIDADWNEQIDITGHRIEIETVDTVGDSGAPIHDDGFRLVANAASLTTDEAARPGNLNPPIVSAGDLLITAGRLYAGGVLAENDVISLVSAQPDLPTPTELGKFVDAISFPPKAAGTYLAYLDVWPRLRTAIDDPEIREVALGGPDSCTRVKNAWQVKFLPAAAGDDCASPNVAWDALLHPKLGTLAASVAKTTSKPGPCIVDPGAGYRRLENQLYRVEVHTGGDSLAKSTFKWSRDNGAIVTRWISKDPLSNELELESVGRDKVLNIAPGHWVELTDDAHEELFLPGTVVQVTKVSGNIITIDAASATGPVEIASFPKNPKVRRWDSAPAKPGKWIAPDGEKTLNSTTTFELEDGVVVQFGLGAFRTGDYWLIPARTALPYVEWPTSGSVPIQLPPHGITHQYAKLAIVQLAAGVFTISDCRRLFPPLTELASLFYVSGESQEATPDPTKPAATLLPLAHSLKVGIANGEWPVAGARVRFTIKSGSGALTPASGIVLTGSDGVASCDWSLDSGTPIQELIAEWLDDADSRIHLPVIFHARLNTAKSASYNPANCEGMKNAAPPVVTVQDAIDFLCHEEGPVECCVAIGKLGDRPGEYSTVAEAVTDLIKKRKFNAICLTLLPGDHIIDKDLLINPESDAPLWFKIDGCSHASRLHVRAPIIFKKLEAVVLRDISIVVENGGFVFDQCSEVEVSHCLIKGVAKPALLQFAQAGGISITGNKIQALGTSKSTSPEKLLAAAPELAKTFALVDNLDFATESAAVAAGMTNLASRDRSRLAKELRPAFAAASAELTTAEKNAYKGLLSTLASKSPTAKTLTNRLSAIRASGSAAAAPAGTALSLLDFDAAAVLLDNRIDGGVSFGGLPGSKPLTSAELKNFTDLVKKGAVQFTSRPGALQFRGNSVLQIAPDDTSLTAIRKILESGNGALLVWASAHYTDNVIGAGSNYFTARHLSISTTRFLEVNSALGLAVARTATYMGNSDDSDVILNSLTGISEALAANLGLNIVIL